MRKQELEHLIRLINDQVMAIRSLSIHKDTRWIQIEQRENRHYSPTEIKTMTTPELQVFRDELTNDIARIKIAVDSAKREAAADGVYADRDWFTRAEAALRFRGRDHQIVLQELGSRRRAANQLRANNLEARFLLITARTFDRQNTRSI